MSNNENVDRDRLEFDGMVTDASRDTLTVILDESNIKVLCKPSGKLRKNHIKVLAGDRVRVEVGVYDMSLGRVIKRYDGRKQQRTS